MYDYLVTNTPIAIIFIILIIALAIYLIVKLMQKIGLEKVREIVYEGFVTAEHKYLHGENAQKFEYVVHLARSSIPAPFNLFITDTLLRDVIQIWFDLVKDLLDDGKLNKSGK